MKNILDKSKVIRKLGNDECLYDNEILNENFLLTHAFRTKVSKKYQVDHELVKKALQIWVKRHPLLQSYIHRTQDIESTKSKVLTPRYFAYLNKSLDEYNNVEISETKDSNKWIEVIESELKIQFGLENEPLWRIKIIKLLDDDKKQESDHYDFIITVHHSIGDGRNIYAIMIQFLDILGCLLEGKTCEAMNGEVEHSTHTMEEMAEAYRSKPDYKYSKVEEFIDNVTHRTPSSIGNPNGVCGRFVGVCTESAKLQKLIKKMKKMAPECKLTSLLAGIFCMAYKKACQKHDVSDISLDSFQIYVPVSIREKLGIKNSQMGVYSPIFVCRIDKELNNGSIWGIAEEMSKQIHHRIKSNEDFEALNQMDETISLVESDSFKTRQITDLTLSNICVMNNTKNEAIKAKEHYFCIPAIDGRFLPAILLGLTTVDGNLCWAISYDEKVYKTGFFDDVKDEIVSLVDQLV